MICRQFLEVPPLNSGEGLCCTGGQPFSYKTRLVQTDQTPPFSTGGVSSTAPGGRIEEALEKLQGFEAGGRRQRGEHSDQLTAADAGYRQPPSLPMRGGGAYLNDVAK